MNWLEPLEFTPCSPCPLDSYLHVSRSPSPSPPPPDSDPLFAPDSSLEQELCSNFSCCGLALHDLHSLLEHFEESHVVVLGPDGRPLYPSPSSYSASSAFAHSSSSHPPPSPHASFALNYPHPGPPAPAPAPADFPLAPALQYAQAASTFRDLTRLALFPPSPPIASASASPAPGGPLCLPPALLTVAPAPTPARPQIDTQMARAPGTDSPVSALDGAEAQGGAAGAAERAKARARRTDKDRARRVEFVHREGRERKERQRTAGGRRRDREKTFVCPRPGCTKAYLNPNGLKYHLEKGTCTVVLDSPSSGSEY